MTQSPIQKTCARCKKTKSVTKYWRSSRTRDGFDYYCRDCRKIAHNETRARHKVSRREKERDAARKRPSPPVTPEQREQHNARMRQHYREHRDRYRARDAVKQAVLRGERLIRGALSIAECSKPIIIRPTVCRCCGRPHSKSPLHSHHYRGYQPPYTYDVISLCCRCHRYMHEFLLDCRDDDERPEQAFVKLWRERGRDEEEL